jgi:N utilization substance protein B
MSAGEVGAPKGPARGSTRGTPRGARQQGARHNARALALQGLYGWIVGGGEAAAIAKHLLTPEQLARVDEEYFRDLLGGTIRSAAALRAQFAGLLDRPVEQLSPIEHGLLLMGIYELSQHPEVPWRVVINEAVELAKSFGGTDGFRYVNGVLDKVAARLRPEAEAGP